MVRRKNKPESKCVTQKSVNNLFVIDDTDESVEKSLGEKSAKELQDESSYPNDMEEIFGRSTPIRIYMKSPNSSIYCYFGELNFQIENFSLNNVKLQDYFTVYIGDDEEETTNRSALYFQWCDECDSTRKRYCKCSRNSAHFYVKYTFEKILWKGISNRRYFACEWETLDNDFVKLKIYLLETALVNLVNSSEFHYGNKCLEYIFKHFYGIHPIEKPSCFTNFKIDIDLFFNTLKNYVTFKCDDFDVQHPYLLPKLRSYQTSAVKWMLHQEKGERVEEVSNIMHPLYSEITSLDGKKLYYNLYGNFITTEKPSTTSLRCGGILADEMGLGKTVEVLACIMCHIRPDVPQRNENSIANVESLNEINSRDTTQLNDSCENNLITEGVDDGNVGISSNLLENSLKLESNDLENVPQLNEVDKSSKNLLEIDTDEDLNSISNIHRDVKRLCVSSGRRRTRNSSLLHGSSVSNQDEIDSPKMKSNVSNQNETDSPKNTVDFIIENVIVSNCWDGEYGKYKKNGSYKNFKNMLKKRKKDPYYMLTLRERLNIQYLNSLEEYSCRITKSTIEGFFDLKVNQKSYLECFCGKQYSFKDNRETVQCTICSMWQHRECVKFIKENQNHHYICPHCWTTQTPILSRSTLIICPSSILPQWLEEIEKHVKAASLKIYVYPGVSRDQYIQPRGLADNDIVLVSYETLRKELNYVDLLHSNSEEGRRLRLPKRFMAAPSPLPCVEWWRVCLDEAQMVEGVSSKTAEMAQRLMAVNRWCITGTPIQKSLNDLQGLLMFLNAEPYAVPQWWKRALFDPFYLGEVEPLYKFVGKYLWRNSKKDVITELDIPPQTQMIHWLDFSAVEKHFYEQLHKVCESDALQRIRKFPDRSIKLQSLDRKTLSSLLQPLLKLRQSCTHPQVVKGQFVGSNRKTLTMEELLENMLKKAKLEAEDAHRLIVASWNGLAAIDIINGNYVDAVSKYREVLLSVEQHRPKFKTDSLQQLHTIHNLNEILQIKPDGILPTLRDDRLEEEAQDIRSRYLKGYPEKTKEVRLECEQNTIAVEELKAKVPKRELNWWYFALESQNSEFVNEVREELLSRFHRFEEHKCILYSIHSKNQLLKLIDVKMKSLASQRREMISCVTELITLNPSDLVNEAIDCHLRPGETDPQPCKLCVHHTIFITYEEILFYMKDASHSRMTDRAKETQEMKEKLQMLDRTREGHWGLSELERILKFLQTKALSRVESFIVEDANAQLQAMQVMKREFKNYRILWRTMYDQVSALDEVNMATIRYRLRLPGEEVRPVVQKEKLAHELEKKTQDLTYIFDPTDLPQLELKLKSEKIISENDLRLKLGQVYYLENLKKTTLREDGSLNMEPCPVCKGKLGQHWKVFLCGHSYCLDCVNVLLKRSATEIKCPICRQGTKVKEIAYVEIQKKEVQEKDVKVSGSLSTKIEGIVRQIMKIKSSDPESKILVFSSWNEVLDIIAEALATNGITHRCLIPNKFQANLSSFKTKSEITVLLLPVSSGANGLNLTEARHVFLVEPMLNPASEVQAIGRIHRIGQTKPTVVHRFAVRDTIEERMLNVLRSDASTTNQNSVSVQDLYKLFVAENDDPRPD